jgi:hypothetical protein
MVRFPWIDRKNVWKNTDDCGTMEEKKREIMLLRKVAL